MAPLVTRQQFGIPIAKFEGIQKPLARMAGTAYIVNAARLHTAQSLSCGEKPSVASAILKYHLTEMARQCTIDAMDIHDGQLANLVTSDTQTRARLVSGTHDSDIPNNPVGVVNALFLKNLALAPLYKTIRTAIKAGTIIKAVGSQQTSLAHETGVLSDSEAKGLMDFDVQLMDIINVDDFDPAELYRLSAGKPHD